MNIENKTNYGISGVTIELSLSEMIVLKNTMNMLPAKGSTMKYSEGREKEREAISKIASFIAKITEGVQSFHEAEKALFENKVDEMVERNYNSEPCP